MDKQRRYKIIALTKIFCVSLALCVSIGLTLSSISVSAVSESELMEKVLLNALNTCYDSQYMLDGPILASDYNTFGADVLLTDSGKKTKVIYVPTQVGNSVSDAKVTCEEVFNGASGKKRGSMTGLFGMSGQQTNYIAGLGYSKCDDDNNSQLCQTTGNSEKCLALKYTVPNGNSPSTPHTTNSVCFAVSQDGKLDTGNFTSITTKDDGTNGPVRLGYNGMELFVTIDGATQFHDFAAIAWPSSNTSWDQFVADVKEMMNNGSMCDPNYPETCVGPIDLAHKYDGNYDMLSMGLHYTDVDQSNGNSNNTENYVKRAHDTAVNRAISYFSKTKYTGLAGVKLNGEVVYELLQTYFQRLINESKIFIDDCYTTRNEARVNSADGFAHFDQTAKKWCSVRVASTTDRDAKYNVVNNTFNSLTPVTLTQLLELITNWNDFPDEVEPGEDPNQGITPSPTSPTNPGGDVTGGTSSDLAECLNNASSLGWILCPVLSIVSKTVDSVYSDIEENWLPIDNNLISTTAGIYDAWKVFRDFANIVFVIMLAVIVISQITGFGISNYGIKKMLPSLIVIAVLVNMSFLFCQLAVDVINIVGAEVGSIFARIGSTGNTSITGGTIVRGAIATIFSAAGVGVAATVGVVAIATNPGLLVPILIFGIGLIITLFFFYAILAIRKAGIYAMIILSPLAIVCYAFPNTKNLFDKWKKLFTALLVVYPICQIVTGGGQMISGLMLKDGQNGFIYNIVAVILSFAPIFLIPSLIRSSLAGLGNIGTKLSQLGGRMRGATTGRLNNSDIAKRLRTHGAYLGATQGRGLVNRANTRLRNARGIGGLVRGIEDSGFGRMIGRQNARKDAQAKAAYRKLLMDDAGAANIADTMTADTIENDLAAQEYKYRQDLISNTADGMLSGRGIYEDAAGMEQSINTNDLDSLSDAWEYYMNQYDATGDDNALLNAQALTHLMMENNGDKGRTRVMNNMKARNFDAVSGVSSRSASFNDLSRYINRNSKWMTGLKAADTGSFRMIGDAAKGGNVGTSDNMANLHEYNTAAHDKLTSGNVRDLGDSFFDGVNESAKQGVFDFSSTKFDQARFDELAKIRDTFKRTMSDPRTAEGIKPDMLREMNKINRIVYNGEYNKAHQAAYVAWEAQSGNVGKSMTDFDAAYVATHGGKTFQDDFGHYKDLTP